MIIIFSLNLCMTVFSMPGASLTDSEIFTNFLFSSHTFVTLVMASIFTTLLCTAESFERYIPSQSKIWSVDSTQEIRKLKKLWKVMAIKNILNDLIDFQRSIEWFIEEYLFELNELCRNILSKNFSISF